MSLWDWAGEAYGRPGVEPVLLELQDLHGQSASLLLWVAWAVSEGWALDGATLKRGAELAAAWERTATAPLRQARHSLNIPRIDVHGPSQEALREQVRAVELDSEHLLLDSLEALTAPVRGQSELAPALLSATAATARSAPASVVQRLSDALLSGAKVQPLRPTGVIALPPVHADQPAAANLEDEAGIRAELRALQIEHQDLNDAVGALAASPMPDMIQMARLKKKKLILRDEITALEDRLTPDIIA